MSTYKAGQVLTADDLNQAARGAVSAAGSSLVVTTTSQDIPGASVTVTTTADNAVAVVHGVFDVNNTASDLFVGRLDVDGVTQSACATAQYTGRATVTQTWVITLATAGSHTLKLTAYKSGAAGTVTAYGTHTNICALIPGI